MAIKEEIVRKCEQMRIGYLIQSNYDPLRNSITVSYEAMQAALEFYSATINKENARLKLEFSSLLDILSDVVYQVCQKSDGKLSHNFLSAYQGVFWYFDIDKATINYDEFEAALRIKKDSLNIRN